MTATTSSPSATYLIAHEPDGSFRLADAQDVAATRWRCHVMAHATTWRQLAAAGLEVHEIAENYWHDLDAEAPEIAAILEERPHLRLLMPPAAHDVRRHIDGILSDHPPALTADPPLDLPDEVLGLASRIGESFMSPGNIVWEAPAAGRAIHLLNERDIRLVDDPLSLADCLGGRCSCEGLAHDLAAVRRAREGRVARDQVLQGVWISDGYARPDPSIDLVVTVAPGVDRRTPVAARTVEVVAPFEDSQFRPIDEAAFTEAVEATVAALGGGQRLLVRCEAGVNRSALVVAEAMARSGYPRHLVVELVRQRRPGTLSNSFFADIARGAVGPDMRNRS